MKIGHSKSLWIIVIATLLLVSIILVMGYQSFKIAEKSTFDEFNQPQPVSTQEETTGIALYFQTQDLKSQHIFYMLGLSILIIFFGGGFALWLSLRTRKLLQKEVRNKTRALGKTHEELKAALNKLETVYAFQQSIIDGIAEPIMVIDANYQVKLMNRAAQEFSPQSDDTSEPKYCYQVSHQCEVPCKGRQHPCPMEMVRESGKSVTVIHEHTTIDGDVRFVEVIASPLWNANGEFQGVIEATRDITARKTQMEDALAEQAQLSLRSDDDLGQFAYKIVKSLQDFLVETSVEQSDEDT